MKKGFTYLEILLVIAVLALLTALALPAFDALNTKSKIEATREELLNLRKAILTYYRNNGNYPSSLDDLRDTYISRGFHSDDFKMDAWNNYYVYEPNASPPKIYSYGENQRDDNGDENLDIVIYLVPDSSEILKSYENYERKIQDLSNALILYFKDCSRFPQDTNNDCQDLYQLIENTYNQIGWNGPYLSGYLGDSYCKDMWFQTLTYQYPCGDDLTCCLVDSQNNNIVITYHPQREHEIEVTRDRLHLIILAINNFLNDNGRYPNNLNELVQSGYLSSQIARAGDGWGTPWDDDHISLGYVYSWGPNKTDNSLPPLFGGDDIWN